ncbi:MBL fold metallo-hydrolase [Umezawaea tangerina]|uniref:Glyoxylase-like metal-dependent hydrolase (Beta-lactamase superfamily II) n=1 Tax=Umezawaea tangerina TaxID=84725 RepID=A0A2T0SVN2_9PSEU|nr:MBL fold metallo-hydrolase [Umezawaea tangerina]PRY37465.1 glyoxylase-like metal-dependent hydrolase (beta-lactamase superfamily II) [Umezawaea tangerina]
MDVVHRLGDGLVNFYLVDTGEGVVLVDSGLPGHWRGLLADLDRLGFAPTDVTDVLVTHAHPDHIGLAERLRVEAGARIHLHEREAGLAAAPLRPAADSRPEKSVLGYALRRPSGLRTPVHLLRLGGLRTKPVADPVVFTDGLLADVPGRPLAVHTPGHTHGSTVFVFQDHAFTGDALVTSDPMVGSVGPSLLCRAFTNDGRAALESLRALEAHDVPHVHPGHGDQWHEGLPAAVRAAVAAGVR